MFAAEQVEVFRHRIGKRAPRLQHGIHVGQLALDELELTDALAELLALVNIGDDVVHHRLHDPERPAGEHGAFVVQAAHQHPGAAVELAEDVFLRHLHVLEHQLACVAAAHAQLVQLLRNRETLHALFDQKGRDAACAQLGLGLRVHHQGVGVRAIGDPHLVAIEQVAAALVLGLELHADHVRARAGLAHGQRTDMLATDQLGQVLGFLRGVAVAADLVHAQVAVRAVGQAHRGAGARDFLHRHHVREVAHVGAAILLGHGHSEHAQRTELAPYVHRKLVTVIDLGGTRRDFRLCKITHRIAQRVNLVTELKVQTGQARRAHGGTPGKRWF